MPATRLLLLPSLLLSLLLPAVYSIAIDNGVDGDPDIECGVDSVTIKFRTQREFHGNVYVKGHFDDNKCHIGAPTRTTNTEITVPHSACNTQRTRSLNPPGIQIFTTVIISFHPAFLTKIDRAYAVQCFYMEATKTVNARIEVSMQQSEVVTQTVTMPNCRYEVLRGGPNGSPVRYARIGEAVYHKWTCDSESEGIFCMLVHSCQVSDSEGQSHFMLVDEAGCSTDRHLLQHIQYFGELSAGRETHVFKFADKPQLHFQCQISLVVRENAQQLCPKPQCPELPFSESTAQASLTREPFPGTGNGGSGVSQWNGGNSGPSYPGSQPASQPYVAARRRRNVAPMVPVATMDIVAPHINVLELEDGLDALPDGVCPDYPAQNAALRSFSAGDDAEAWLEKDGSLIAVRTARQNQVCVSTAAFSIVITATLIVAITTVVVITMAVYRGAFRGILTGH